MYKECYERNEVIKKRRDYVLFFCSLFSMYLITQALHGLEKSVIINKKNEEKSLMKRFWKAFKMLWKKKNGKATVSSDVVNKKVSKCEKINNGSNSETNNLFMEKRREKLKLVTQTT